MNAAHVDFFRCPTADCREDTLSISIQTRTGSEIVEGAFTCSSCKARYPIQKGIACFLPRQEDKDRETREHDRKVRDQEAMDGRYVHSAFNRQAELEVVAHRGGFSVQHRTLDAGCGIGECMEVLQGRVGPFVGCDISFASLQKAQERSQAWKNQSVSFVQASLSQMPFRSGTFDRIVSCQVLQHLPSRRDVRLALSDLARIVKPLSSGALVLTLFRHEPDLAKFYQRFYGVPFEKTGLWNNGLHFFRYDREDIEILLGEAGLSGDIRPLKMLPDRLGQALGKGAIFLERALTAMNWFRTTASYWLVTARSQNRASR